MPSTTYQHRIANAKQALRYAPNSGHLLPFVYVTASFGCWHDVKNRKTMAYGGVGMSALMTCLLALTTYLGIVFLVMYAHS